MKGNGKTLEIQLIGIYSITLLEKIEDKNKTNFYLHLKFMYIVLR